MSAAYKPIKFFLNICGNRVHNLDELCTGENFHLNELYDLFTNGILERWLLVHEYKVEYDSLSKLPKDPLDEDSARKFCSIMRPDDDTSSLEMIIQNFKIEKKWKENIASISKKEQDRDDIINKYHSEFKNIKQAIKDNSDNMPAIKANLAELSKKYLKLFNMNQHDCIEFFKKEVPIVLLMMLANPVLRNELVKSNRFEKTAKFIKENLPYEQSRLQEDRALFKFVFPEAKNETDNNVKSIIHITNKHTQSMWEDIEPNNKEFMILHADSSTTVRPYKDNSGELSNEAIEQFPIIKGIDYRSSNDSHYLVYMEI